MLDMNQAGKTIVFDIVTLPEIKEFLTNRDDHSLSTTYDPQALSQLPHLSDTTPF